MIKTNMRKMVLAGLSLAILSGCANTRGLEVNDISNEVGYVAPSHSELSNNIQVETSDFIETRKISISRDTTLIPSLSNKEAKEAITILLKRSNLYNANGDYKLVATLKRNYVGTFTTTRNLVINYKLLDKRTNRIIFEEDIDTDGRTKPILFGNPQEVSYRSGLDAFNKNFYEMTILIGNHDK